MNKEPDPSDYSPYTPSLQPAEPEVLLLTRLCCAQCRPARYVLKRLRHRFRFSLRIVDLDDARTTMYASQYRDDVPVVLLAGQALAKGRLSEVELGERLRGSGVAERTIEG